MHLLLSLPLNSSGTEEEYSELSQLLQDISDYQRDLQAAKLKERESRKLKELNEKAAGEEMRKSAMETMARKYYHVIILVFLFVMQNVNVGGKPIETISMRQMTLC